MALFSTKKSKAKKAEKARAAEQKKVEEEKPATAPYRHTPSHAAADSQSNGKDDSEAARQQIAQQSQRRMERAHTDTTLGDASGPQAMAQNAYHGRPTPSKSMRSSGALNPHSRNNSGYFNSNSQQAPSFDSPILGNPKMQAAARDRGYINPHYSVDSGYGSVGPSSTADSRAPSTHRTNQELQHPPLLRQPTNFLPELTLGQELAREPAFSESSYTEGDDTHAPRVGQPSGLRREYEEAQREQAESTDKESIKSSRSSRSRKQTRFEEAVEPVPAITQQQHDRFQPREHPAPSATRDWQERPAQQPSADYSQEAYTAAQADSEQNDLARENTVVSPVADNGYEMMSPYGQNVQANTRERGREQQQYHLQPVNAASASNAYQTDARQASQSRQRSGSVPPLSILDGLKVNKRGRILDEEGDPIGELCDGDIMDCVRQKANAFGEVLDEYGGIVGRVRTLPRETSHSVQRSSLSSRPGEDTYFSRNFQLPSQIGTASAQSRRQSLQQPMPSQQQQETLRRVFDAPVVQEAVPALPIHQSTERRPSVAPLDMPKSKGAVELDASQPMEQEPVFDFSEPFMPPPHVPARSSRRSESPSDAREGAELATTEHNPSPVEQSAARSAEQPSEAMVPRSSSARGRYAAEPEQSLESAQAHRASVIPEEDEDLTPRPTPVPTQQARGFEEQYSGSAIKPAQQAAAAAARPLPRATSERQGSFTRSPMSSVAQDPPTGKSPTLFAYKGDIPSADGPAPGLSAGRAKAPPLPSFPRQAFAAGAAGGSPFAGSGVSGAPSMPSRRVSSNGVPMSGAPSVGMQRPGMKTRYSTNTPLVRSPLSSHETTPPDSDEGSSEGADRDQLGAMSYSKFRAHSRAPSVRTVSSVTSQGKPRTYFTHSGRVTVDAGELPPSAVAAQTAVKNAGNPPPAEEKKEKDTKKKSRLSLFGSKKK